MDNVPEEIQLPDVCIYCEGSGTDHKHGEGRAHGDCCGVHGAIRIYSGSDAHQWVIDCYKGKNEALAATRQNLEAAEAQIANRDQQIVDAQALIASLGRQKAVLEQRLETITDNVYRVASFLVGNGDVCEIAAGHLRAALAGTKKP